MENPKIPIVTKTQNSNVTKLKNQNCDITQKLKLGQNPNCAKTENSNGEEEKKIKVCSSQKIKLWQNLRTQTVTKLKN